MTLSFKVYKKLGTAGVLGVNKPVEYGGLGLDYKWQMAVIEAAGAIRSTGVAMAIGVQVRSSKVIPALPKLPWDSSFLLPCISDRLRHPGPRKVRQRRTEVRKVLFPQASFEMFSFLYNTSFIP